ncbi:MAG: RimK-like ATPgrasp N-terminal domain-containing protein [Euryarchaeota archaeon]|nr:RimK-like ATPgrasp N-terminal domain-containing protein [Euryarchaeota archaeon]
MAPQKRRPRHTSPLGARPGAFINLSANLRFARAGYLASMDAELAGLPALPATRDLLAAFHPVLFHYFSHRAGIPVPDLHVVEDPEDLEAPCRLLAAHPYMWEHKDAKTLIGAKRAFKSVSMGGGLPVAMFAAHGKPFVFRAFLGMTLAKGREELAWNIWERFHLPLMTVYGFDREEGPAVTHIEPLELSELTERDLRYFQEVSERPYSAVSWTA